MAIAMGSKAPRSPSDPENSRRLNIKVGKADFESSFSFFISDVPRYS